LIGRLIDTKGKPVAGATIGIYDFGNLRNFRPSAPGNEAPCNETRTDKKGNFRFKSIELNSHDPMLSLGLGIDRDGFSNGYFFIKVDHETHCLVNADNRTGFRGICFQDVNLIEDLNYEFNFKMMPGGTVSGRLVSKSGLAISNTRVRLVSQKQPGYYRTYTTDEDGRFRSFALSAGKFDIEVESLDDSNFNLLKQEFPKCDDSELDAALLASKSDAEHNRIIHLDGERFYKFDAVTIEVNNEVSFTGEILIVDWLDGFHENQFPPSNWIKNPSGTQPR